MANDDVDLVSETRFIPKFLETAVEDAVMEINAASALLPSWTQTLVKEWGRYVRWRAHVTNNPALLENIATQLDGAAGNLRRAREMMAGKAPPLTTPRAEGFDGR